jgi:hypothetical protein
MPADAASTLDATDSDATAPAPFDAASCTATAPPEAATVAQALAQALSVTADKVQIACVEEVNWPSGCLGLPAPELCSPGPVPGYVITLRALDNYYVYHTSKKGAWFYAGPGDQPRAP